MNAEERIKEAHDRHKEKCFKTLVDKVQAWGDEKKITDPENVDKQFMKFIEEVFEFKTELDTHLMTCRYSPHVDERLRMEMGDILVTLAIMAKQLDIDLVECLDMAYEKIKKRKGKTIDGTFVKEEDL